MRNAGRLKLGFYPLPIPEAMRLRGYLSLPDGPFSAMDPCVGHGAAFHCLLDGVSANRYGIELDGSRAVAALSLGIDVLHADALEVRCGASSLSLLYLNPPYDFEVGPSGSNKRMELVFLKHTGRWLKPRGVLIFVIPQSRLKDCARTLAEQFADVRVYRLQEPESVRFNQIAVLARRRGSNERLVDTEAVSFARQLEGLAAQRELQPLSNVADTQYPVPLSEAAILKHDGIPLDAVEDQLLKSPAYRARLNAASLRTADEPVITGELVREIKNVLQDDGAPRWMAHFYLADDPPQNAPGRFGKSRRRVDIEFERGGRRGTRPRLHFESKRLNKASSVSAYLGDDGLRLFVTGEYASMQDVGGMIGYVQVDTPAIWVERIRGGLTGDAARFGFRLPPGLIPALLDARLELPQLSHHDRAKIGRPIAICHTFLRF